MIKKIILTNSERRKRDCDAYYRVKKANLACSVDNNDPTMRRTNDTSSMRRRREIMVVEFVGGKVKNEIGRKHEIWELRWYMERDFGNKEILAATYTSESEIVYVD